MQLRVIAFTAGLLWSAVGHTNIQCRMVVSGTIDNTIQVKSQYVTPTSRSYDSKDRANFVDESILSSIRSPLPGNWHRANDLIVQYQEHPEVQTILEQILLAPDPLPSQRKRRREVLRVAPQLVHSSFKAPLQKLLKSAQSYQLDQIEIFNIIRRLYPKIRSKGLVALLKNNWVQTRFIRAMEEQIQLSYQQQYRNHVYQPPMSISSQFKVTTLNLGLLNGIASVPYYGVRSNAVTNHLSHYLKQNQPDVMVLQELWHGKDGFVTNNDIQRVKDAAKQSGYEMLFDDPTWMRQTGLQILVPTHWQSGHLVTDKGFFPFISEEKPIRASFEYWGNVKRGLAYSVLTTSSGSRILVGTVHLTPLPENAYLRALQIREIDRFIRQRSHQFDHVILSGDFNMVSDFEHNQSDRMRFELDRMNYLDVVQNLGFVDAFRVTNSMTERGFTINSMIPFVLSSDRNTEQRLDYTFSKSLSQEQQIRPLVSRLVFTEPLVEDHVPITLSDHYGIETTFALGWRHE